MFYVRYRTHLYILTKGCGLMSIEACLYALYLRKSRKDLEAERNGIDTLERHEKISWIMPSSRA